MSEATPPPGEGAGDPLFREEAVRDYIRGRTRGRLLGVSPAWTRWVFLLLAVTIAGAALFIAFARIDHEIAGPAVVRASRSDVPVAFEIVALLPAEASASVREGTRLVVRFPEAAPPPLDLSIGAIEPATASGIVVHASIPAEVAVRSPLLTPGLAGRAEILAGRRTIARALFSSGRMK